MLIVHVYIEIAELERGINFYCDGLGLSLKRRLSPNWVELDGASLPIFLLGNRPPVADLQRGINFYCAGLGLSLRRRLSASWVELEGGNLPLFLLGNRAPIADLGGRRARRSFAQHWTPVHLDFVVADLDAVVVRLTGLGATLDRPIQYRDYGRMANLADPFGNGFDLIEFSGVGYDSISR